MLDYRRILRLRFGRRGEIRREVDEEVRTHIELRAEELMGKGMSPEEARVEAERRFGDVDTARRRLHASAMKRDARLERGRFFDHFGRDVRLAARRIFRAPGYASVSISILALVIALTTIMFAVVDGVLLRPLPFPEPDRLVSLQSMSEESGPYPNVSMANWFDWQEQATTLAATGIWRQDRLSVRIGEESFRATGTSVGGRFFETIQPTMLAGRPLTFSDGQEIALVTVLSSGFATLHFGSPDDALGRTVEISGRLYEVVGVSEGATSHPEQTDLWVAFFVNPGSGASRNSINFEAVGRLAVGADIATAEAELDGVARGIRESDPEGAFHSWGVGVLPLRDAVVAGSVETLWLLMIAVAGVLLVACANLAGLGLARARGRAAEVSLRMALGSGRARIVRQFLVEYLGMAVIGGALGFALAWGAGGVILDRLSVDLPRADAVVLDLRIALFTAAVTVGAGLLAGILPALRTASAGHFAAGHRTARGGRGLPGGVLVATEVALALSILIGGALLLRSLQAVVARDLGFEPQGVLTTEIDLNGEEYRRGPLAGEYWRTLIEELEARPAVASAAVANWIPAAPGGTSFLSFPENPEPDFGGGYRVVSEGYFETMGIPWLEGRGFGPDDHPNADRVTVVNRAMAERAWPGRSAIGQQISAPSMERWMYDGEAPWLTVIGVVDDIRHWGYEDEVQPELYVFYRQLPEPTRGMKLVVRGRGSDRAAIAATVQDVLRSSSASPAFELAWLGDRVDALLGERIVTQRVLAGFSLTALLLMCLGIYGLVAHAASQRTREMAVRAALGARRSGLLGLMLTAAGRVIAIGTVVGLAVAYGLAGLLESLLIDVPPTDPFTFALAAGLLAVVGAFAALVPSVQAARLDPIEALRGE